MLTNVGGESVRCNGALRSQFYLALVTSGGREVGAVYPAGVGLAFTSTLLLMKHGKGSLAENKNMISTCVTPPWYVSNRPTDIHRLAYEPLLLYFLFVSEEKLCYGGHYDHISQLYSDPNVQPESVCRRALPKRP